MGFFIVVRCRFHVGPHHTRGGVSQHFWQGKLIFAIAQEYDCRCVPNTVRVDVGWINWGD